MPTDADPFDLQRFVDAQAPAIDAARAELATGAKRSHWMWFVFPQAVVLGRSETARFYGLRSRAEAAAYWRHPQLGPRLVECAALLEPHAALGAERVLGSIDARKLRSCLTLFEAVAPTEPLFGRRLDAFYRGARDPATMAWLAALSGRDP